MISRRALSLSLAGLFAASRTGLLSAQTGGVPVRLGFLWIGAPGSEGPAFRGLAKGLADVGLIEGKTVIIERRYASGRTERLAPLAKELVDLKVAVILVAGTVASKAVQAVTETVPIIASSADPVGVGLAASLSRPGRNLTGMAVMASEQLVGKWLELLLEAAPGVKRAAFLTNPESTLNPILLANLRAAAQPRGIEIVVVPAIADIDLSFMTKSGSRQDGAIVGDDALLLSRHPAIIAAVAQAGVPAVYGHRQYAEAGGLLSYASDIAETWRRAGGYVEKILNGAAPGELPIQQPTKIELVVNLKTARAMSIDIPSSLLARADEVIE